MPSLPADLAAILRKTNGDLSHLRDLAKKAPASARVPLKGSTYTLPVANPGKIILPRPQLPRARQGRPAARQHPEIPDLFHARPDLAHAA